jgi:hypothetical protein
MMRCPQKLEIYRQTPYGWLDLPDELLRGNPFNGMLRITSRGLLVVFSNGGGWEHVSVSLRDRCPTWDEMEWVKRQMWHDTDTVMQLHVPVTEHRSFHKFCLHLWRPMDGVIPRPPADMVAPPGVLA